MVFVSMAQAPPKAGAKELLYSSSLNLIHEFTSVFSANLLYVGLPRKAFPGIGKGRHWTSVFFCGCASNAPRFTKASPIAIFK